MVCLLSGASFVAQGQAAPAPKIFPEPREIEARSSRFTLDPLRRPRRCPIRPLRNDVELSQFLVAELVDKHGLALKTLQVSKLPDTGHFILMGDDEEPFCP